MHVAGKIAVVTGAARGIGRAIAEALIAHGAKVAICDLNIDAVSKTAQDIGALPLQCDVTRATDITAMIDAVERDLGPIDIFVSNAGIIGGDPTHAASAPDAVWQKAWDIHVMAHVWAAQRLLPTMIERRSGYLINIASAAGLLNQIGDAPYSATKSAAISLAESLAISHGDDGIAVSVVCPQYVASDMLGYADPADAPKHDGLITPADVATAVMDGIAAERFLILPHPIVETYTQNKANDYDRWIRGMRKLRRKAMDETGSTHPEKIHFLI